jgi:hypothetical protein
VGHNGKGGPKDDEIINKDQNQVHEPLKSGWRITETKWHHIELVQAGGAKSRLPPISSSFCNLDLPVATKVVNHWDPASVFSVSSVLGREYASLVVTSFSFL